MRDLLADVGGASFRRLPSLEAAQSDPHGIAVLEGDDGGTVYAVVPAREAGCSLGALQQLLVDLDERVWPHNPPNMRHLYFESRREGEAVPGGMGGGLVAAGVWLHPEVARLGLTDAVLDVIAGKRARVGDP